MNKSAPIYVVLSSNNLTQSQVEEINRLTRELGQALKAESEEAGIVSYVDQKNLPENAKVADLLIFAGQLAIQIAPTVMQQVTPWILSKIDNVIKSFSSRDKSIAAKVIVGNREIPITPRTTTQELDKATKRIEVLSESPGSRFALLIGNSNYIDTTLPTLNSPAVDVERFARVLEDPNIGGFDHIDVLIDKGNDEIAQSIEHFFGNKRREDLLLLYYSGHGIKSANGQLFLAAKNTTSTHRRATSVTDTFIKDVMNESDSQRQILILDCCFGGTLVEGAKSSHIIGQSADSILPFESTGSGRIIITASDSMQYATDGKSLDGNIQNSVFTQHLIRGLETGQADSDNDGVVDIVELYYYAHDRVVPKQNPKISTTSHEGRVIIGINPDHKVQPAQLPEDIKRAMQSEDRATRLGSIRELEQLLLSKPGDRSIREAVKAGLRELINDDRRSVSDFAKDVYSNHFGTTTTKAPVVDHSPQPVPVTGLPAAQENLPAQKPEPIAYPQNNPIILKPKNEILGAFLNWLGPGAGDLYAGDLPRAALTFIIGNIFLFVSWGLFPALFGDLATGSLLCAFPLSLALYIYLFIDGMNAVKKYNKMLGPRK